MKSYHHLTLEKTKIIIRMYEQGYSMREIATNLDINVSNVCRNLKKSQSQKKIKNLKYSSNKYNWNDWIKHKYKIRQNLNFEKQLKSEKKYYFFLKFAHLKINYKKQVIKKLYSPAALIKIFKIKYGHFSYPTKSLFYKWINQGKYDFKRAMFPIMAHKRAKFPKSKRKKWQRFPNISERETAANKRSEKGHMEIDSVIGKQNDYWALATMIDRKSRQIAIAKYRKYCPQSFLVATLKNMQKFKKILTITMDNGWENSSLGDLKKYKIRLYNTDTYASYQKGTLENYHRFIRRFKPKGETFDDLSNLDIKLIEKFINEYPKWL